MPVQVCGDYRWWAEYDDVTGADLYANSSTDAEAIGAAAAHVQQYGVKVHVRRGLEYLAEVRPGYQGAVIVEHHAEDGTVREFELPGYCGLVACWLDRVL